MRGCERGRCCGDVVEGVATIVGGIVLLKERVGFQCVCHRSRRCSSPVGWEGYGRGIGF